MDRLRAGALRDRAKCADGPASSTIVVGILAVMPGRATLLQAGVHLVLLAAFLFLTASQYRPRLRRSW